MIRLLELMGAYQCIKNFKLPSPISAKTVCRTGLRVSRSRVQDSETTVLQSCSGQWEELDQKGHDQKGHSLGETKLGRKEIDDFLSAVCF